MRLQRGLQGLLLSQHLAAGGATIQVTHQKQMWPATELRAFTLCCLSRRIFSFNAYVNCLRGLKRSL